MNASMRNRRFAGAIAAACLSLIVIARPVPTLAQGRGADITLRELQTFDNFLDRNPAIDKDLRQNPALAKDAAYLAAHPELKVFLQTHPGVQNEISKSPRFFVRRAEAFDHTHKDITLAEVRSFDAFLDDNPDIDGDLSKNPALIRDAAYLNSHPDLREYLRRHPAVAADLRESPRAFMWRERALDQRQATRQDRIEELRDARSQRATAAPRATQPQARPNLPGRSGNTPGANRGLRGR